MLVPPPVFVWPVFPPVVPPVWPVFPPPVEPPVDPPRLLFDGGAELRDGGGVELCAGGADPPPPPLLCFWASAAPGTASSTANAKQISRVLFVALFEFIDASRFQSSDCERAGMAGCIAPYYTLREREEKTVMISVRSSYPNHSGAQMLHAVAAGMPASQTSLVGECCVVGEDSAGTAGKSIAPGGAPAKSPRFARPELRAAMPVFPPFLRNA